MLTRDEALRICEAVLAHVRTAGAEDAVVTLQHDIESHARLADNRITTSGRSEDITVTATAWVERRRGSATGNDTSAAALEQLARDAVQIARISPVDREYLPSLGPLTYAESRAFAAATAEVDPATRAGTLEAVLAACRAASVTGAAFHTAQARATAAATANGNRRYFQSTEAGFSLTARTPDGTGAGYVAGDHFDLARLDVKTIADQAVRKAVTSARPRPIEPGTYPVILEPQAVSDLVRFLMNAFDARMADEGRSAFSLKGGKTRVGEALFDKRLSMFSDPMHAEMPAVPATAEGVPATRLPLVTNGVLENLDYSRIWADRQKRAPSPGPVNFIVEGSGPPATIEQMIAGTERGLLVSRFWYVRLVDPRTLVLTGLTRDGLWWIEKGRISHPVGNLRFNQSVLAMLAPWNVDAIGATRRLSPLVVPALKLAGFTFTSVSDAI